MACRILYDKKYDEACFYDSVSQWAFGPIFGGEIINGKEYDAVDVAELFLDWLGKDPRSITYRRLENAYSKFEEEVLYKDDPDYTEGRKRRRKKSGRKEHRL
jgi:hypothetical protein